MADQQHQKPLADLTAEEAQFQLVVEIRRRRRAERQLRLIQRHIARLLEPEWVRSQFWKRVNQGKAKLGQLRRELP